MRTGETGRSDWGTYIPAVLGAHDGADGARYAMLVTCWDKGEDSKRTFRQTASHSKHVGELGDDFKATILIATHLLCVNHKETPSITR